jgi:hypothetical protein
MLHVNPGPDFLLLFHLTWGDPWPGLLLQKISISGEDVALRCRHPRCDTVAVRLEPGGDRRRGSAEGGEGDPHWI